MPINATLLIPSVADPETGDPPLNNQIFIVKNLQALDEIYFKEQYFL